jgi:hypothetical protein
VTGTEERFHAEAALFFTHWPRPLPELMNLTQSVPVP